MIKKIYQISDVHIPTYEGLDKYSDQLNILIDDIRQNSLTSGLKKEEMRIVICGDLVNSKNRVTNELNVFTSKFIRNLSDIAKVYCIAGNHDLIETNTTRTDTLTAIFHTAQFDNAVFLDEKLGYESGILVDDNIIFALYSFYDSFRKPDIKLAKIEHPNNKVFGLYHGQLVGTQLFNGIKNESGQDISIFSDCDYVLAGHIHKRQAININGCKFVYAGSVVQKDFGETVTKHGYVIWDIQENDFDYTFVDIPCKYGLYDFTITSIDDIKNNKEILNNY